MGNLIHKFQNEAALVYLLREHHRILFGKSELHPIHLKILQNQIALFCKI